MDTIVCIIVLDAETPHPTKCTAEIFFSEQSTSKVLFTKVIDMNSVSA
jgi:hypothetical protein